MTKRISGMSFDSYVDGDLIHIEKISLDITDNSAAAQTRGVPDGHVDGDVTIVWKNKKAVDIYIVVRTWEVPLQITISLLLDASLEATA